MANPWAGFQNLIDKDAITVGEIDSVNPSEKTSVIVLLGGDYLKVRGTGTVGNKVIIKGGEIIQDIGAMPQYDEMLY